MDTENEIINYLDQNQECYDRFTFDSHMRYLLQRGYDHVDAKDMILAHCHMSAITFQERIYNEYYLKISKEESIAEDLKEEIREMGNGELNKSLKRGGRHN